MTADEFNQMMKEHAMEALGTKPKEMIHHPDHYQGGFMEVIEVLENFMTKEQLEGFCKGNVIKYLLRSKEPETDLQKARQYLNYLIDGEF